MFPFDVPAIPVSAGINWLVIALVAVVVIAIVVTLVVLLTKNRRP